MPGPRPAGRWRTPRSSVATRRASRSRATAFGSCRIVGGPSVPASCSVTKRPCPATAGRRRRRCSAAPSRRRPRPPRRPDRRPTRARTRASRPRPRRPRSRSPRRGGCPARASTRARCMLGSWGARPYRKHGLGRRRRSARRPAARSTAGRSRGRPPRPDAGTPSSDPPSPRRRARRSPAGLGGACLLGVDGELGVLVLRALLESRRHVGDEPRPRDLRLDGRDDEGDPNEGAQRSALFRRPKKPPSSSRDRYASSPSFSSSCSTRTRCSASSVVGTATSRRT